MLSEISPLLYVSFARLEICPPMCQTNFTYINISVYLSWTVFVVHFHFLTVNALTVILHSHMNTTCYRESYDSKKIDVKILCKHIRFEIFGSKKVVVRIMSVWLFSGVCRSYSPKVWTDFNNIWCVGIFWPYLGAFIHIFSPTWVNKGYV